MIKVPASKHGLETTAPKFDTQVEEPPSGSSGGGGGGDKAGRDHPTFVSASNDANLFRGTLYPDAAISEYLPRCKASIRIRSDPGSSMLDRIQVI